jgi:hypothetical protein
VKRVTEYKTFEDLLDGEGPANVNPASFRKQQLANIREIYPAEQRPHSLLCDERPAPKARDRGCGCNRPP